jgi:hypothetical protein
MDNLPEPGVDLRMDRVRELINRTALNDPAILRRLLHAILRILRDNSITPGVPLSMRDVEDILSPPVRDGMQALVYAMVPDDQSLVLALVEGGSREEIAARLRAMSPEAGHAFIEQTTNRTQ